MAQANDAGVPDERTALMSDTITPRNAALEGRYRIGSELGEGGIATVYLADDIKHEGKPADGGPTR